MTGGSRSSGCGICDTYVADRGLVIAGAIARRFGLSVLKTKTRPDGPPSPMLIEQNELLRRLTVFLEGVHARHIAGLTIEYPS